MEANMEILSVGDLGHLTRDELCDLSQRIEMSLPQLAAGSLMRMNALASLANIRRVMLTRGLSY
jgi:hypothetical protein